MKKKGQAALDAIVDAVLAYRRKAKPTKKPKRKKRKSTKLACMFVVLCILIAGLSYAQSQPPTPTPGIPSDSPKQQATNKDKKTAPDQRGTEQAPLVIKILEAEHANEKAASVPNEGNHKTTPNWWPFALWPTAEYWLAIFTLGLFIATCVLARANWLLVKGAEDTARRQLRAYVYMQISPKKYPPKKPNRYANSLIVTNGGKTWARNLTIQKEVIRQELGDNRDPFDLMKQATQSPMVLGPGQTFELQFGEVKFSDVPEIAKRNFLISYVALARYEDTVSPSVVIRQTHLSNRLNGDTEGAISFGFLPTHNCADEDCP
jgi:hypothetical protein